MLTLPLTLTDRVMKPARAATITRRDGTVLRINEFQTSLTVGSETWEPTNLTMSAVKHQVGGDPSSISIEGVAEIAGTPIALEDIANGKYDSAEVLVYMLNRADLTSKGLLFNGTVGPVKINPLTGRFSLDCRGIAIRASSPFSQVFSPMCRTDLGSTLCKIPIRPVAGTHFEEIARLTAYALGMFLRVNTTGGTTPDKWSDRFYEVTTAGTTAGAQPAYTTTVGATQTDGSAVLTCRDAWTRAGRVATIIDQFSFTADRALDARAVDNWFNAGVVRMHDGYSAGQGIEVGSWTQSTRKIVCYLPIRGALDTSLIAVGDWFEIWRGCAKRRTEDCFGVFANAVNFRGEDTIAGVTAVVAGGG